MKKIFFLVVTGLLCISVQAQIVSSRSYGVKMTTVKSQTEHFWRFGLNMMTLSGDETDGLSRKAGYTLTFGFMKPLGSIGTYWGMEYGLGSRGYKFKDDDVEGSLMAHNVQFSPFTFGWKYEAMSDFRVDVHLGIYASGDYAGKLKEEFTRGDKEEGDLKDLEDWKRYDAGMNVGFGLWYSHFNLDFTLQRGFIGAMTDYYTNNFMIRLGIAF